MSAPSSRRRARRHHRSRWAWRSGAASAGRTLRSGRARWPHHASDFEIAIRVVRVLDRERHPRLVREVPVFLTCRGVGEAGVLTVPVEPHHAGLGSAVGSDGRQGHEQLPLGEVGVGAGRDGPSCCALSIAGCRPRRLGELDQVQAWERPAGDIPRSPHWPSTSTRPHRWSRRRSRPMPRWSPISSWPRSASTSPQAHELRKRSRPSDRRHHRCR
jgi:hypothetical protein